MDRVQKITNELAKRMISNCGRWCEITMKNTNETYTIIRTGYGSMEYPEKDSANVVNEFGSVIFDGKTLYEVAEWINSHY